MMQLVGLLLDSWIIHSVKLLLIELDSQSPRALRKAPLLLGYLFLVCHLSQSRTRLTLQISAALIAVVTFARWNVPLYRSIFVNKLPTTYPASLVWATFLIMVVVTASTHLVSQLQLIVLVR